MFKPYRDSRADQKRRQRAHLTRSRDIWTEQQRRHARKLTSEDKERRKYNRAKQVGVPGEVQRTAVHDVEGLLDNDRVHSSNHGAHHAERYTDDRDRRAVKEDTNEETEGHD